MLMALAYKLPMIPFKASPTMVDEHPLPIYTQQVTLTQTGRQLRAVA